MCRVLVVSTSGYYAWKNRSKSLRRIENERLLIEVRKCFIENNSEYGSPRIWRELKSLDILCCENRVARLMRWAGLVAVHKLKFRATTNSKHNLPVWPNVLNRNFVVPAPDKAYVSDITYLWTREGWLYLAIILDLYSRGVVGLAMDKTMAGELVRRALIQAILRRSPDKGLICHSDRGSQYAAYDYKAILSEHGFVGSMSRKGDCWDNAVAESFIHTLKVECIRGRIFATREEAKRIIFPWVETRYNRTRIHSTLGYLSPFEYERQYNLSIKNVH